jgi:hypothetical protein
MESSAVFYPCEEFVRPVYDNPEEDLIRGRGLARVEITPGGPGERKIVRPVEFREIDHPVIDVRRRLPQQLLEYSLAVSCDVPAGTLV